MRRRALYTALRVSPVAAATSPRLFVVPPGTRRVTVTVELEGYAKVQRVVQVDTEAVVRVQFDLQETPRDAAGAENALARSVRARAEGDLTAAAGASTPSKAAAAPSETPEQLAARFARAMSQVDTVALREFWHITDDLQLDAAEAILASLTRVQLRKNGPVRIEPVHAGRIGRDQISAYYVVEAIPPLADGNGPWTQGFERVDGQWVTQPMPHLRTMAEAHRIARALNAYRATCKVLLRAMRHNRPMDLSPLEGRHGRSIDLSPPDGRQGH